MSDDALTPERILDAAEDVLRRYGPSKATVVDVARALDVSHGSVYRHFASKAALRDAVTKRWLERVTTPLGTIARQHGKPEKRLRKWLDALIALKRRKALDDPELFATYMALASEATGPVEEHLATLSAQVERIVRDGVASGDFVTNDAGATARAVLMATSRFHHPKHAADWKALDIDAQFASVWALVIRGLTRSQ